ncbi:MAG: cache domain-containing protein [Sulfurimonas sp.]|nr:cache domain-containing protein [Sulfurimonas sp.]
MLNETNILRLVAFGPLIVIPLVFMVLCITIMDSQNQNFRNSIEKLKVNSTKIQEQKIETKIDQLVKYIENKKSIIEQELKDRVTHRVYNAYTIANAIYKKNKGIKSEEEIKNLIKTALGSLSWNNNESFIWMVNFKGMLELAPKYLKHLENTSIISTLGQDGKFTIKNEIKICKEKQEGFLWDTYTKSGQDKSKQFEQLAFVKSLGFYDLYIGSAEYISTAKKRSDKVLLSTLSKVDSLNTHYLFILKEDGTILLHTANDDINLDVNVSNVFTSIVSKIKGKRSTFVTYIWRNPNTKEMETKVTYIKKIPNSDWIIGSGYYKSELEASILKQSAAMHAIYALQIDKLLYICIILMILVFIISYALSVFIKKIFASYQKNISTKNLELMKVNETLEEKVYARTKELENINNKLNYLATTDSLTQVHNRYSILEILTHEIQRAKRNGTLLSVVLFDIDFFKKINDTYGHDKGDSILCELAALTSKSLRNIDFLGRYGGEEFLIVMPDTSLENALTISTRVKENIQNHHFEEGIKVTVSLGLVQLRNNENIDELLKRADELMYTSKENGRNKITTEE